MIKILLNKPLLSIDKEKLKKQLCFFNFRSKGRNNSGKITSRHKGGGHKRLFRKINFVYNKYGIAGEIIRFEYDPNRNTKIALINYKDNEKRYCIFSNHLTIGSTVVSGPNVNQNLGSSLPLAHIKLGSNVNNVELVPNGGSKITRSSGAFSKILAKNKFSVILQLPSKEVKAFNKQCFATIGQINNTNFHLKKLKKAGYNRWKGIRPSVRGVAMNPIDHPHGGGEGKSSVGRKFPCTPWGKPTLFVKTSNSIKNFYSNFLKKKK